MCNDWQQAAAGGKAQLENFLQDMASDGVSAIAFNAIYRADESTRALWCGLAGGEYRTPNTFMFASVGDAKAFVASAHSRGIAVMSWMNPSYIFTGSSMFKQTHDVNCLKNTSASVCSYFDWKSKEIWYAKRPSDTKPAGGWEQNSYVNDESCAYYSYWASQPTTTWTSPSWAAEWKSIAEFWLQEIGIDGFIFDYPDGYHPVGQDSGKGSIYKSNQSYAERVFVDNITGPVTRDPSKAAFGELYAAPDRASRYGLSGTFADDSGSNGFGTRDDGKLWNIANFDAADLDTFYGVTLKGEVGGIDSFSALCQYQTHNPASKDCTVPWSRVEVSSSPGSAKANRLSAAIPLLGGAFVAVEYVDYTWWSAKNWSGASDLKAMYAAVRNNPVLQPLTLRAPVCFAGSVACTGNTGNFTSKGLYAMLRWDPFQSGQVALVIFNLGNIALRANLDLNRSLGEYFKPGLPPTDLLTGQSLSKPLSSDFAVDIAAQDVVILGGAGLRHGRRWHATDKSYSCRTHGFSWPVKDIEGETMFTNNMNKLTLPQCMMACARTLNCNTVTVGWSFRGDSISSLLNGCWLRRVSSISSACSVDAEYSSFALDHTTDDDIVSTTKTVLI
jgi:hypothetical protein